MHSKRCRINYIYYNLKKETKLKHNVILCVNYCFANLSNVKIVFISYSNQSHARLCLDQTCFSQFLYLVFDFDQIHNIDIDMVAS